MIKLRTTAIACVSVLAGYLMAPTKVQYVPISQDKHVLDVANDMAASSYAIGCVDGGGEEAVCKRDMGSFLDWLTDSRGMRWHQYRGSPS